MIPLLHPINISCSVEQFKAIFRGELDDDWKEVEGVGTRKLKLEWTEEMYSDLKKLMEDDY